MTKTPRKHTMRSDASKDRVNAWQEFGAKLQKVLRRLKEDYTLVLCEKGTNHFVQFIGLGASGLRAETVSNSFLRERERLSRAQMKSLIDLGWQPPTGTAQEATPAKQPTGSPNFMREFAKPVDVKLAASLAIATFANVLRIPHPGFLNYEGMDVDKGHSLVWSELGLKVAEHCEDDALLAERLLKTVQEETGRAELAYDEDGDIVLGYGSVKLFVGIKGDPPSVRIVAPIVRDVPKTAKLLAYLNDLNSRVVRPTFFHASKSVFAITDLPATPFERHHLVRALREFCTLVDGIDEVLQAMFGGQTAFDEHMPSTKIH